MVFGVGHQNYILKEEVLVMFMLSFYTWKPPHGLFHKHPSYKFAFSLYKSCKNNKTVVLDEMFIKTCLLLLFLKKRIKEIKNLKTFPRISTMTLHVLVYLIKAPR